MAKEILPTNLLAEARMVNKSKWTYPNMSHYEVQEQIIELLFRKRLVLNADKEIVRTKAMTLNLYYGTVIKAISSIANGIYQIPNIDGRLQSGDLKLVDDMANIGTRRNYSFATKYCACHQPNKFPIYDTIVGNYLAALIGKGHLKGYSYCKTAALTKMHSDYVFYKEVYDVFMKQYHLTSLSYRQVDWYIWTACKNKTYPYIKKLDLFKLV